MQITAAIKAFFITILVITAVVVSLVLLPFIFAIIGSGAIFLATYLIFCGIKEDKKLKYSDRVMRMKEKLRE